MSCTRSSVPGVAPLTSTTEEHPMLCLAYCITITRDPVRDHSDKR